MFAVFTFWAWIKTDASSNAIQRRHSITIDAERYRAWKEEQQSASMESRPEYPKSFQEIMELLEKGIPVPGIKVIPDRLHDQPPSQPSMAPRKKPWEE